MNKKLSQNKRSFNNNGRLIIFSVYDSEFILKLHVSSHSVGFLRRIHEPPLRNTSTSRAEFEPEIPLFNVESRVRPFTVIIELSSRLIPFSSEPYSNFLCKYIKINVAYSRTESGCNNFAWRLIWGWNVWKKHKLGVSKNKRIFGERKQQKSGEIYIMKSFILCVIHQHQFFILGRSNQGEWHAQGIAEIWREETTWELGEEGRIILKRTP